MNYLKKITLGVTIILLLSSCKSGAIDYFRPITKLNKIEQLKCKNDSFQRYSLYLLIDYTSTKQYPIVFCFDPHADGALPINLMKESAERYGYILAGSNNSQNGIANPEYVAKTMIDDVLSRYSIDQRRIYVAGFSGGGRIAAYLAISDMSIDGAIVCGAGVDPQGLTDLSHRLLFFITAGTSDFNYPEVELIKKAEEYPSLKYLFKPFEGTHKWPSSLILEQAFRYFEADAMRNNIVSKNESFLKLMLEQTDTIANNFIAQKRYIEAYNEYISITRAINDLYNTDKYNELAKKIAASNDYTQAIANKEKYSNIESTLREAYSKSYSEQDTTWWKKEISALESSIKTEQEPTRRDMLNRLKAFISMASYSYCNQAIYSNNFEQSIKYLNIYKITDERNPDYHYFLSYYYYKTGNIKDAGKALETAKSLGFNNAIKIRSEMPNLK